MQVRVAVIALLVMSSGVHAEERIEQMGLGLQSCGSFAKTFQADPDLTETMYFSWATGFMTGMNLAAAASNNKIRNLGATSMEEKQRVMRRFCDQHPLKAYKDGVLELYFALPVSQPAH